MFRRTNFSFTENCVAVWFLNVTQCTMGIGHIRQIEDNVNSPATVVIGWNRERMVAEVAMMVLIIIRFAGVLGPSVRLIEVNIIRTK